MAKSVSTALAGRIFSGCPTYLPTLQSPTSEVAGALILAFGAEYHREPPHWCKAFKARSFSSGASYADNGFIELLKVRE